MARAAPMARLLHVTDNPFTAPKMSMSAPVPVELWILFVEIVEEVTPKRAIAPPFVPNSLLDTVMFDPFEFTGGPNNKIPLLELPTNLLLSIVAWQRPKLS